MDHRPPAPGMHRFFRDREGATIIEFAVIAPIFFLLLFGIVEFGLIQFSKVALESATAQVARDATLGKTADAECAASTDRVGYIQCLFENRTAGLINGDNIYVSAGVVNGSAGGVEFTPDICMTEPPTAGGPCPLGVYEEVNGTPGYQGNQPPVTIGNAGDMIEIKVFYPWKITLPFLDKYFGSVNPETGERNGILMLTSSTVVKNEPF